MFILYVVLNNAVEQAFMGADGFFKGGGVDFRGSDEFVNDMAGMSYPFVFLLGRFVVASQESWFPCWPVYRRDLRPSRATRRRATDSQVERKWRRILARASRGGGRGVSNVSRSTE